MSKTRFVVHRGIGQPEVASFTCDDDFRDQEGAYEAATKVCDALNAEYREGYRDGQIEAYKAIRWNYATPLRYVVTYIDDGWSYPTAACETCDEIHTGACHNPEASDEYE